MWMPSPSHKWHVVRPKATASRLYLAVNLKARKGRDKERGAPVSKRFMH